jgi:hypothetical protein
MVKGLYKDRASITLLAENGVNFTWGENSDHVVFDWGWMSKSCGYGEKKATETIAEKVMSRARSFGSGRRTEPKAPTTDTSAGSLQPASAEQTVVHQTTAKGSGGDDEAYIMVSPPQDYTKDQRRTFYKQLNSGLVPQGFKSNPPPKVKILKTNWDEYCKRTGIKPIADVEPIVSSNVEVKTEIIPKAPPVELKDHKDRFMKRPTVVKITNEGRGIIDPKRIQATEEKYATYPEIAGHSSIMDVYAYSNEDISDLIKHDPTIAMILMSNLIGECIRRTPEEELNPKVEKTETKVQATGTDNKVVAAAPPPRKAAAGGARTFGRKS